MQANINLDSYTVKNKNITLRLDMHLALGSSQKSLQHALDTLLTALRVILAQSDIPSGDLTTLTCKLVIINLIEQ